MYKTKHNRRDRRFKTQNGISITYVICNRMNHSMIMINNDCPISGGNIPSVVHTDQAVIEVNIAIRGHTFRGPPISFFDVDVDEYYPTGQPHLRLGTYGGPLKTIPESPVLQKSVKVPGSHRFSSSLTLPSSIVVPPGTYADGTQDTDSSHSNKQEAASRQAPLDRRHSHSMPAGPIVDWPDHDGPTEDRVSQEQPHSQHSQCDSRGRCIHHPHIRLRKKKVFGSGWKELYTACPDCCIEEMLKQSNLAVQYGKKIMTVADDDRTHSNSIKKVIAKQRIRRGPTTSLTKTDRSTDYCSLSTGSTKSLSDSLTNSLGDDIIIHTKDCLEDVEEEEESKPRESYHEDEEVINDQTKILQSSRQRKLAGMGPLISPTYQIQSADCCSEPVEVQTDNDEWVEFDVFGTSSSSESHLPSLRNPAVTQTFDLVQLPLVISGTASKDMKI